MDLFTAIGAESFQPRGYRSEQRPIANDYTPIFGSTGHRVGDCAVLVHTQFKPGFSSRCVYAIGTGGLQLKIGGTEMMMLTTLIGAATLALGPCNANECANSQIVAPEVIEINAAMLQPQQKQRRQIRFSDKTRGEVVAVVNQDGSTQWPESDREKLGGEDAPAQILVRLFDGVFAIDPFQPLPAANDSTAAMLFRGTTLETDRTHHGRQYIERTHELLRKLEQARHDWLRNNGFYGVQTFTSSKASGEPREAKLPEPSAVFERPADVPRGKSREQVNADTQDMGSVAQMLGNSDEPVRVSLPPQMQRQRVARTIQRNRPQVEETNEEVALKE